MVYGELGRDALKWATQSVFGLNQSQIPERIVISPYKIDQFFEDFFTILKAHGAVYRETKTGFMVWNDGQRALFCRGAIGASMFADIGYVLCNSRNVEEVIFLGTGGGISLDVKTADINIPTTCLRLDKVLEIMLPLEAPAKADKDLASQVRKFVEEEVKDLVNLHDGLHATVPFLLCENKPLLVDMLNRGVLSVDMELSVLYALANHFSKKAVGIIRIDDLPLQGLLLWDALEDSLELKSRVHTGILRAVIQFVFSD
ncbi:MAG: hypothetical protein ACFFCO_08215 [Promethearchaeota archaeon]